ncbi:MULTISPECIES: hypothetical protein [Streptomyces]|uniref:hypothetical protein n=1 Tax=Streptomyces TaxID=1883 RepID=UPI0031F89905
MSSRRRLLTRALPTAGLGPAVATVVNELLHPEVPPRGLTAVGCSATEPLLL